MKGLILVEGKWDQLFFQEVIQPLYKRIHPHSKLSIKQYKQLPKQEVANLIRVYAHELWILTGDHDRSKNQCITQRRIELQALYSAPSLQGVCLVVREIEDWYSAGITTDAAQALGIEDWGEGKLLRKEFFKRPGRSEIDIRKEVLKQFSHSAAYLHSPSYKYVAEKLGLAEH